MGEKAGGIPAHTRFKTQEEISLNTGTLRKEIPENSGQNLSRPQRGELVQLQEPWEAEVTRGNGVVHAVLLPAVQKWLYEAGKQVARRVAWPGAAAWPWKSHLGMSSGFLGCD